MRRAVMLCLALTLVGCRDGAPPSDDRPAPTDPNVCWRVDAGGRFKAVAYDVANLEQCAIFLESLRLEEHHDVVGLWNGVYIRADERMITASVKSHNQRYLIFTQATRAQIDADLGKQIASKNAAAKSSPAS